jgi:hypothetical protein
MPHKPSMTNSRQSNAARAWEMLRDSYLAVLPRQQQEEYTRLSPQIQQEVLKSHVIEKARLLNPRLDAPARRRSLFTRIAMALAGRRRVD